MPGNWCNIEKPEGEKSQQVKQLYSFFLFFFQLADKMGPGKALFIYLGENKNTNRFLFFGLQLAIVFIMG